MTSKSRPACIYCGGNAKTRDHIPPKAFFPKPRPSDMLTVPSCAACNSGFQLDDEYAHMTLLARDDISDREAVQALIPQLLRSLERPEGKALPISIVKTARDFPIYTSDGVVAGTTAAYGISSTRMHRFAVRIVRGLFFTEMGYSVPTSHDVGAALFLEGRPAKHAEIGQFLDGRPIQRIGDGVFAYCWNIHPADEHTTVWMFSLYDRVGFGGLTSKRNDPSAHAV